MDNTLIGESIEKTITLNSYNLDLSYIDSGIITLGDIVPLNIPRSS